MENSNEKLKQGVSLLSRIILFGDNILMGTDAQFSEVVVAAVVDVEVHISLDARQLAGIRVLPKLPRPFILHFINIIVGYPIRIVLKDRGTQVVSLNL